MNKKEIQEKRMKEYFIQATKEILKGEGLKNISARNIADRAGYSYATLYNYFKDINELIFVCVKDFQIECEEFVSQEIKNDDHGINKIKSIIKAYVKYFIQYPGIFELFYMEKVSDISRKKTDIEIIYSFLDRLCMDEWTFCTENEILNIVTADKKRAQIRYTILSILLLYITRRHPASYKEFMVIIDEQLINIFE